MNWLHKLFHLCEHRWEEIERYAINRNLDGKQVGTLYVLRCQKCGDITRRRT